LQVKIVDELVVIHRLFFLLLVSVSVR